MKIIKLDEDENIIINFLDEQLNEFNELSEKRKNAGSLGGKASAKQRLSKSKQMLSKPQALREDKIREDNIYKYNEFYDNEIKLSNNNETYIQFVKILFGENDFKRPLNAVLKLQEQCSWKQFDTLLKYKKDYNISIRKIIEDMEGWKDIRKNKTLVGTFRTFVKRNYAKKD